MALIEQEIGELRKRLEQLDTGKLSYERLAADISIYSQIEKRARLLLAAKALCYKEGARARRDLEATNLIGNGSAIDLNTDPELEAVRCQAMGKVVTRGVCLDYSGDGAHLDTCMACVNFAESRKAVLPPE